MVEYSFIYMTKQERAQLWDERLSRVQQEAGPETQGRLQTAQPMSEYERKRREEARNKELGLVAVERESASVTAEKWKSAATNDAIKRTKQKIYQVFRNQELKARYPDVFPKPNKPAIDDQVCFWKSTRLV
jgi:hypothetical protein